ncbi:MAG: T9SS type A sorting domain-containing protein [Bacteroidales bacterium]|nr:T9SS type A sorting domain-containing protein [Bacteroidales bacterium]
MKNLILLIILGFLLTRSYAQIINANPDSTGTPWIVGKVPEYTPVLISKLNSIPELELTDSSSNTPLSSIVDNSLNKYMRTIFPQEGNSCSPAAGIGYNFTYEINRLRDIDVSNPLIDTNLFPTHFAYNYLNGGIDTGSNIIDCWDIVIEQGCPTVPVWGGMAGDYRKWMTGYNNYDTSFYNKLKSYSKITITDSTKLDVLKHWLSDHNEGDSIGGLANFIAKVLGEDMDYRKLQVSPDSGKWLINRFGSSGNHTLTIVGYHDSIMFDNNNDGLYTDSIDINNDDTVDIRDWKIGVVKVANSWGNGWKDSGYIYVPYRLLAESVINGGIKLNHAYVIHLDTAQKYYKPDIILKLKIQHPIRNTLSFHLGHAPNCNYTDPVDLKQNCPFSKHKGGTLPMQGINDDPIEIEFDFSYYFDDKITNEKTDFGKVFLEICEQSAINLSAIIYEFSMIDYRWNEEFELVYDSVPIEFSSGQDTILMGIEYDLIPFEMDYSPLISYNYSCNKICRRHCQANDSSEVTFGNGINVDFYKGTLVIEEGATLTIGDSVTIHAKTGADSLIVYGDIEIGDHVNFIADEDASLFIYIENDSLTLTIDSAYFENMLFEEEIYACTINKSEFSNSMIKGSADYFLLSSSELTNTPVRLRREKSEDTCIARVEDCIILYDEAYRINDTLNPPSSEDHLAETLIGVEQYHHFLILNDSIVHDELDGVTLYYAGSGVVNKVKECHIHFSGDVSTDTSYGMIIYKSYVDVINNFIEEHTTGVACLDKSNSEIRSEERNPDEEDTQHIINNKENQIYALDGSFPHDFQYNYIHNDSIPDTNYLVYYNTVYTPGNPYLDVRNNYWGQGGIDTLADLYPNGDYIWYPEWNGYKSTPTDSDLFTEGKEAMADGNYALAESKFKEIIEYHSDSKYVKASVKILLVLKRLFDQDFEGLQNYLDSIPTLWEDEITANVTDHVINWCNIEKEDYVAAIIWFEDQIENPNSYADSICAIIDLGYTYTLMDTTSNKSSGFIGNYPQYKPVSREAYEKNREYLVDLLFRKKSYSNQKESKPLQAATFNLQQNYPNPVRETTTIKYSISQQSYVKLNVYNTFGSMVKTLVNDTQSEGEKLVTFNIQNLSNGMYYYSLQVDNEIIGVRKMVVLR